MNAKSSSNLKTKLLLDIRRKQIATNVQTTNAMIMCESVQLTATHTHTLNGPFSGTTRVSRYQKGKTSLDFTEARDGEWQWHQQGRMQVCTLLQTDNHTSTPPLSFFTGRMPFPLPNQQRQSTEGKKVYSKIIINIPYMLTSLL